MQDSILTIDNLSVSFGNNQVVSNASLELFAGKTLALVGESGSGKSVTAHSILKLLPYPLANHSSGRIAFQGNDLLACSEKELRNIRGNSIAMIFQEPMTALNPLHTIGKQISESILLHKSSAQANSALPTNDTNKKHIQKTVVEWLQRVGIADGEDRLSLYPHELSGGQRQRVMIAMALINQPQILIADEPTTALDVTVQKQILELIENLKHELNMAVLLISHDLHVVRRYSDSVAVMKNGKIVECSATQKLFENPQYHYTRELINAEPEGRAVQWDNEPLTLLTANNINVSFPLKKSLFGKTLKQLTAVKNINLSIKRGETLGIIGESGSGKSTLAMAILQLQKYQGHVFFNETPLHTLRPQALATLRSKLQIVFQDPFASLSPRMTIAQIIAEGLQVHEQLSPEMIDHKVQMIMDEVNLDPALRHRYPHEFSGGQRQRIAIARAVILQPEIIVLDEPTSALDRAVQKQVIELLRNLQKKYKLTYLFISHDLKVIRALAHSVAVMRNGEVIETGATEDIMQSPQRSYTKSLLDAAWLS